MCNLSQIRCLTLSHTHHPMLFLCLSLPPPPSATGMFLTIALVAGWCYHIIGGKLSQSLRESEGISPSGHAAGYALSVCLPSRCLSLSLARALSHTHTKNSISLSGRVEGC
jgi:hypothetical protein